MTKISSCQSIKFGASTDVLKVYAGSSLVWDSGVVPPVTEFPPSAIYAWDFDVVDQNPPDAVEGLDLVLPKVGDKELELPVLATLSNPFSGIRAGTLLYGSTYDDGDFLPQVRMNSTEWQSVKAISGSFRIDPNGFPNPDWANGDFLYLCHIAFNFGAVASTFRGDILLGFELKTADPPVRGDWDLVPTVWRAGDQDNFPDNGWIKSNKPYGTLRMTEGDWFTWHARYDKNNLNFTITDQRGNTARVENISTYWGSLIDRIEFSGSIATSDGNYYNSGNCSWDNLALHDISFQSNDPQPLTCERYAKYFQPESGEDDDLACVWDFNQTGDDAFQSCERILFGQIATLGCNANGSCQQVDPILPDQYHSCGLNQTIWTPDGGIADVHGLSYWFSYNGDNNDWPGVVLGSWLGGNRFLLIIETVYDALTATKARGTKIVASMYDLFDPVSPEVPVEQFTSDEGSEINSDFNRFYVQISNRKNWAEKADDDQDWYVTFGEAYYEYGQVQRLEKQKELSFRSTGVDWSSSSNFVSLNKTPQGYEANPEGRNITIDKVAFWVNPDVMGFDAL